MRRTAGRSRLRMSTTPLRLLPYAAENPPVENDTPCVRNGSTAPRKPPVGVS
jgi:hypothetical protein